MALWMWPSCTPFSIITSWPLPFGGEGSSLSRDMYSCFHWPLELVKYNRMVNGMRGLSNWMGTVVYPLHLSVITKMWICFSEAALQIPQVRNDDITTMFWSSFQTSPFSSCSLGIGVHPHSGRGSERVAAPGVSLGSVPSKPTWLLLCLSWGIGHGRHG